MLDTVRLYLDATLAVAFMAVLGIISGFIADGVTGDRVLALIVAGAVFLLTGAILIVRLWRITQRPALPLDPGI